FIRRRVSPPQDEIDRVLARMQPRVLQPGELFCAMGDTRHELGILLKGALRIYTLSESGDDLTMDFIFPVNFVAALDAATPREPSRVAIEALEVSELGVWPFGFRNEMLATGHREWENLNRMETEAVYRRKNRFALALQSLDAETRYRMAQKLFPPEFARVPQYH